MIQPGNAVSFSVRSPSDEVKERNKVYTELAYLLYGGAADSPAVDRIVEDIFLTTEIRQYYNPAAMYDSILPSGNRVATLIDESNNPISFYSDHEKLVIHADDIARIVIDYLGDHYRYSLTPPKPTSDDSMEEFLLISKEGYCVQFATAATLIMRRSASAQDMPRDTLRTASQKIISATDMLINAVSKTKTLMRGWRYG